MYSFDHISGVVDSLFYNKQKIHALTLSVMPYPLVPTSSSDGETLPSPAITGIMVSPSHPPTIPPNVHQP